MSVEEMEALVAQREDCGPYRGIADLAPRSGASRKGLERLAWAGALDGLALTGSEAAECRREGYWQLGVTGTARAAASDSQLPLPLDPPPAPELEPLREWEKMIENYRATGVNLDCHPLALLRDELGDGVLRSSELARAKDNATIEVAGMVVARQRPETAKGITFMLLEDECGTINLVVPPSVYGRSRELVRVAPLLHVQGRLERREGVSNLIVFELSALRWHGEPGAAVSRLHTRVDADPEPGGENVASLSERRAARELAISELRAVAPAGHSFGRRGR